MDGSKVLLELEQRQIEEEKSFRRSLVVLHLLASLAEDIGPACLQSPEHILSFVQVGGHPFQLSALFCIFIFSVWFLRGKLFGN